MTKPLGRRAFLKVMGAAPIAARTLATKVAALETVAAAQSIGMGIGGMGMPAAHGIYQIFQNDAMMGLHASGLLPEWVKRDVEKSVALESRHYMCPNLMSMKSVSLPAKLAIQKRRAIEQAWADVVQERAAFIARRAFYQNTDQIG